MKSYLVIILCFISSYLFAQDTLYFKRVKGDLNFEYDASSGIQRAIQQSRINNSVLKLEKGAHYNLNKPIFLVDGVTIDGNGATLTPTLEWNKFNERYSAMVNMVNVKDCKLKNLVIDIAGEKRTMQQAVFCSLLLLGAHNTITENVMFKNSGRAYSINQLPNGPHVLILSQDSPGDFEYLTSVNKKLIVSSENNIIRNCKFINDKTYSGFAIRILTNWIKERRQSSFNNQTKNNSVVNCVFKGGFEWNTIELAGGGTVENRIENNLVEGLSINNIDIDKGASRNVIVKNKVQNGGLPSRYKSNNSVRCSPIMVHGSSSKYLSYDNIVRGNTIYKISNPSVTNSRYTYSSGISANFVNGLIIEDNVLEKIYKGASYGAGIVIDQTSEKVSIKRNFISDAFRGIVFTPNSYVLTDLVISHNKITSRDIGIYLPASKANGVFKNVRVTNNSSKVVGSKAVNSIFIGKFVGEVSVRDNTVSGNYTKSKGIVSRSVGSIVSKNNKFTD